MSSDLPSHPMSARWEVPTVDQLQGLLPPYEILALLGRGGMGAVYKGRQKSLNRLVAIKILPAWFGDDEWTFAERFKNEAQIIAQFSHPALVHVYDFGETQGGLLYFIMEYVDGRDVAATLAMEGRLAVTQAVEITKAVCEALHYAHSHGVIHRDIKPANVLIDGEGQVKVADFGLAKMSDPAQASGLTRTNVAMGTQEFAAPEMLTPGATVDHRADIYSLGVMLYQMLTGEVPRVLFKLPSRCQPELGMRFDALICKALETDPADRFQSAAEFREALAATAGAGMPAAAPVKRGGSNKLAWVAIAGLMGLGGGGWFIWKSGTFKKADSVAEQSPQDASTKPWRDWLIENRRDGHAPNNMADDGGYVRVLNDTGIFMDARPDVAIRAAFVGIKDANPILSVRVNGHCSYRATLGQIVGIHEFDADLPAGQQVRMIHSWPLPPGFVVDRDHTFELRVAGNVLSVMLDGQTVGTAQDTALSAGGLGCTLKTGLRLAKLEYMGIVAAPVSDNIAASVPEPGGKSASTPPRNEWSKPQDLAQRGAAPMLEPAAIRLWDSPDKIPKQDGVRWEDGAVVLGDAHNKGLLSFDSTLCRDAILRAEIRTNQDAEYAQLRLRFRGSQARGDFYRLQLQQDSLLLSTSVLGESKDLRRWTLPRTYGPDEWASLEFRAVGDELTVSLDGHELGSVRDASQPEAGGVMAVANANGWFRNVSYVPLDKPMAAASSAGVKPKEATGVSSVMAWDQWTKLLDSQAAVTRSGTKGLEWKDGWLILPPERLYLVRLAGGKQKIHDMAFRATVRPPTNEWPITAILHAGTDPQFNLDIHNDRLNLKRVAQGASSKPVYTELANVPLDLRQSKDGAFQLEASIQGNLITIMADGAKVIEVRDDGAARAGDIALAAASGTMGSGKIKDLAFRLLEGRPVATAAQGRTVDLLPLVDVKRDAIAGEWSLTGAGLVVNQALPGSSGIPRLQLPWQPPEEYDFEIEFTPMEGSGDVAQVLSTKGRSFAWRLDVGLKAGRKAGLETIDGVGIMERKDGTLMRQNLLTNGRRHRSLVEVRKTGICGYLDGEKLVDWGGTVSRLGIPEHSKMRDPLSLGVAAWDRAVTFHGITVREVSGTAPVPAESFRPLFDGKSLNGWLTLNGASASGDWRVVDGALTGIGHSAVMTREEFGDFDLRLDWRVNPQGNGGIFYRITENSMVDRPMHAIEFNLMDDTISAPPLKQCGAAFDLKAPYEHAAHPAGEWNTTRLLVQGTRVEQWINDKLVCRYDLADAAMREALEHAGIGGGFATVPKGRIALQDWSGEAFYRNVRIRELTGNDAH